MPDHLSVFHSVKASKVNWAGELSGAYGDLGTFLPLVMGILLLGQFDTTGILIGFGVFALASGLFFRRPVPVQPMKAIAAYAIVGGLTPAAVTASGLVLGVVLLVLGATRLFRRLDRWVPAVVLAGIQLGLGISLVFISVSLVASLWYCVLLIVLFLLALQGSRFQVPGALVLLISGVLWSLIWGGHTIPALPFKIYWPELHFPEWSDFKLALQSAVLPQFAMTLTNAVLLTALVSSQYFPDSADRDRITPRYLAISTGFFNVLLAPIGAFPMCHGAGGMVAHYHLGARRGIAMVIFGITCLLLGLFVGAQSLLLLALVPAVIVSGLLAYAGLQLANLQKFWKQSVADRWLVLAVAVICVAVNAGVALIVGIVLSRLLQKMTPPASIDLP
ncbi:MAG: putative sulfate/molybdate transporter [Granulosicoccus sp.]|nr:putative sulfate/molybdate transporter [Granulosicoccus sp.]